MWRCLVIGILTSGALVRAAPRGYLVKAGPSPLRFQIHESAHRTVLPSPIATDNTSATTNQSPATGTAPMNPANPVAPQTAAPPLPALTGPHSPGVEMPFSSAPTPLTPPLDNGNAPDITPQMLLPFFVGLSSPTNSVHPVAAFPVGFNPPVLPQASSKAIYKSPPADKPKTSP